MATNPLYTISTLPATSQAAIREFDDRYLGVIGAAPPPSWSDLGELIPTASPMVTFPIGNMAMKYQQTEGESRFKTLTEKSFDVKVEEFDTGIKGKLLDILQQTFAYRNWLSGPARMMMAEARFRNKQIAALLHGGESALWGPSPGIDAVNFFSATHLADFSDPASATWSNYQSSTKDVTVMSNLRGEVTAMQGVLDENGDNLGVDPDTIIVPTGKYEPLKFSLAQNLMLNSVDTATSNGGVTNPYSGKFNVIHAPELTVNDADDWYLVDSKMLASSGLAPWLSLRYTTPNPALQLRHWDESSDYFKDTGNLKVSSHIWYGFSLAMPHVIRKVKGA